MSKFILSRNITTTECPWLARSMEKGEFVFGYSGFTYGCCTDEGKAVTLIEGETPFFELPNAALERA